MKPRWWAGNRVRLLENGEEYFPAVFEAIRQAEHEVILETFIWFEDKVGHALHEALRSAAERGVQVDVLVDGFGSPDLTPEFVARLTAVGVRLRVFDPCVKLLGLRFSMLRRMHRKIVVIDGRRAFVGGINYSADHLADFGPQAKQDYAVEIEGPVVDEIRRFAHSSTHPPPQAQRRAPPPEPVGRADALFVRRDNLHHRNDIERYYRIAIRRAQRQVLIANAYFFPGYRLLHEMKRAARRGVDVRLILQGEPDVPLARTAARMLYDYLQLGGVKVFEYCERPLHGKVAVVDDQWATVGSSNLDPLSLSLNLEANVVLNDRGFARGLRERLERLIEESCHRVPVPVDGHIGWWSELRGFVVFHFLRRFPVWASRLPRHRPVTASATEGPDGR
ncbi:cardiolipin synthase ClsB [Ideonella sp.]|uniref:cardiolipin synthase ClsB n=1 Tax=Ideonella sp. TaxID=1929293 RepID=UPI002B460377|nr:cardiolipin synthase ClsB [Ideonella sp.]HJV70765.1 cardiolipin synthase ClsB [Ideonella sp.]